LVWANALKLKTAIPTVNKSLVFTSISLAQMSAGLRFDWSL
jgi:hypothetical protein